MKEAFDKVNASIKGMTIVPPDDKDDDGVVDGQPGRDGGNPYRDEGGLPTPPKIWKARL